MYDIITFGSASQDVYLKSKKFFSTLEKDFNTGKGICFNSGVKIELDDAQFFSGGGGTNAAATFAKQGLKTAFCGAVGQDDLGNTVIGELEKLGVDVSLVKKVKEKRTNISIIFVYPGQENTVFVHRGASDSLGKEDISWEKIKQTKWFYLAPFSGKLAELTEELTSFAKENGIKVAFNPGYNQLKMPKTQLKKILGEVDVLILNQEEASLITGISYGEEKKIFKNLDLITKGICIMTKGEKGVIISDGKSLYSAESFKVKLADSTGAGDAFGSGFISGLIKNDDMVLAMQLAIANSVSNLKKIGAKEGLLENGARFEKAKVLIEPCGGENSICVKK
jgi:sugar/nucleoside kinase (ribokinase family)